MGHLSFRKLLSPCLLLASVGAQAQHIEEVYNRDTHEQFKLKSVSSSSVVRGPIVTQQADFTFENPFKKLTEASVWFNLDEAAILSGFGYWYKHQYVPGVLMDKNKAWFIYTAITSRDEDPGIMTQLSPSNYHAQVYPLAKGYDFKVRLNTVGFLSPEGEDLRVSPPSVNNVDHATTIRSTDPESLHVEQTKDGPVTKIVRPKQDHVDMLVYGQKHRDGYTYVAGMLRTDTPDAKVKISGLHNVYWARPSGDGSGATKLFIGRRRGRGTLSVSSEAKDRIDVREKRIYGNERGSDAAKLWAHEKLAQHEDMKAADILRLSLAYQIPSSQTALLAVPQQQMKLFKKKEAEFRRKQAEESRRQRQWQKERNQNWSTSSGGDPEIRIFIPEARSVEAVLPDGRSFKLVRDSNGYWGGNYDIPADAPEGEYNVRVISTDANGATREQHVSYNVDRTAPTGKIEITDGFVIVHSEAKLGKAIAVFGDGTEDKLIEISPGLYKLPLGGRRLVKVVLIDMAHNLGEVRWSS